ncbi:MAG: UTP--glucose-1-phosphate uridylyltransferase [Opitutae bacterium]|nr:UTP--glucose-1-phosphate uridylyltransferase [Opitutae bacterium]MBT4223834.1 UTP--glucose-1-phosphate uridylyltransferase [Opitutae bacterium]MBT5377911.1 UTP--glucose-1-phosphate uridylyltransferase [Opitutae bacterium]MBT7854830.1 UTP--glucose-1-phosphate uridylyltransferase [Opitutae bacterium]
MKVRKAVITAGSPSQRSLPLQTLIDGDGEEKAVLQILVEEALRAAIKEIAIVVQPGDEDTFAKVVGEHADKLTFIQQTNPRGYGHALSLTRDFVANEPFLHLVGDHLYVSANERGCAEHLVRTAEEHGCAISAVQETRENLLPYFGTIGGRCLPGHQDLYEVDAVIEKPTPTLAEQELIVPGIRAGHYLCFFGMHVLTPVVMGILDEKLADEEARPSLSGALQQLAQREKFLALVMQDRRYDVGVKYGLLTAQLAVSLNGQDRDEVLTRLLTLLAGAR